MAKDYKLKVINTKVSESDKIKLDALAARFNMRYYELLQGLLISLLRYFDSYSVITNEHRILIEAFATTLIESKRKKACKSFNPLCVYDRETRKVNTAIYLIEQKNKERKQLLAVKENESGAIEESYNNDAILELVFASMNPNLLLALTAAKNERGNFSLAHTLEELVLEGAPDTADQISTDVSEMFNEIRITTGEAINEDIYYKRKNNHYGENASTQIYQRETFRADI